MKFNLKILLWSSFFINLAVGLFGPIYAVFVEQIGGTLFITGSAAAVFSITSGVLIFFISKWEDKIKHQENLLIFGRFLTIIGVGGYLLVNSPWHLFLVEIILGFAVAFESPAFDSLYSKNLQKGKFASQWGMWESMYAITTGVAAFVGGFLAQEYGFRILFIIMTIIALISFLITLSLKNKIKNLIAK